MKILISGIPDARFQQWAWRRRSHLRSVRCRLKSLFLSTPSWNKTQSRFTRAGSAFSLSDNNLTWISKTLRTRSKYRRQIPWFRRSLQTPRCTAASANSFQSSDLELQSAASTICNLIHYTRNPTDNNKNFYVEKFIILCIFYNFKNVFASPASQ